jgi:hypothetical protein
MITLPFQRTSEIVHLEGDVCQGLDKLRIRGIVPVTLPLDAEGIVEVVADSKRSGRPGSDDLRPYQGEP